MDREAIKSSLQDVFHDVFNDTDIEISDDMTAADYEAWDSLNHINLIIRSEAKFGVKFLNAEIARLENVGNLLDLIESKV